MSLCQLKNVGGRRARGGLRDIVEDYTKFELPDAERYLQFFRIQRSLTNAVTKAAFAETPSGKRYPHQRRIPRSALVKVHQALLQTDLGKASSFADLHETIKRVIGDIRGVGELMVYDTAHRIGAYLGLRPGQVYVHAGVREGARALGLNRTKTISRTELPPPLRKLRPEHVEDCLCIYKRELKALGIMSQTTRRTNE